MMPLRAQAILLAYLLVIVVLMIWTAASDVRAVEADATDGISIDFDQMPPFYAGENITLVSNVNGLTISATATGGGSGTVQYATGIFPASATVNGETVTIEVTAPTPVPSPSPFAINAGDGIQVATGVADVTITADPTLWPTPPPTPVPTATVKPNPTVLRFMRDIQNVYSGATPADGQIPKYDAGDGRWEFAADATGGGAGDTPTPELPATPTGTRTPMVLMNYDAGTGWVVQVPTAWPTPPNTPVPTATRIPDQEFGDEANTDFSGANVGDVPYLRADGIWDTTAQVEVGGGGGGGTSYFRDDLDTNLNVSIVNGALARFSTSDNKWHDATPAPTLWPTPPNTPVPTATAKTNPTPRLIYVDGDEFAGDIDFLYSGPGSISRDVGEITVNFPTPKPTFAIQGDDEVASGRLVKLRVLPNEDYMYITDGLVGSDWTITFNMKSPTPFPSPNPTPTLVAYWGFRNNGTRGWVTPIPTPAALGDNDDLTTSGGVDEAGNTIEMQDGSDLDFDGTLGEIRADSQLQIILDDDDADSGWGFDLREEDGTYDYIHIQDVPGSINIFKPFQVYRVNAAGTRGWLTSLNMTTNTKLFEVTNAHTIFYDVSGNEIARANGNDRTFIVEKNLYIPVGTPTIDPPDGTHMALYVASSGELRYRDSNGDDYEANGDAVP